MSHCGAQGNGDVTLRCGCGAAGAGVAGRVVPAVPLMAWYRPGGGAGACYRTVPYRPVPSRGAAGRGAARPGAACGIRPAL
jgi:hypothetical protein